MNKKSIFVLIACISIGVLSCKKDDPEVQQPALESYFNASPGSSRTYSFTENNPPTAPVNYILTPAGRDTTIENKVFTIFNNSNGTLEYYNKTGNDYYNYQAAPGGLSSQNLVNLYLKSDQPVNTTWTQPYSFDYSGITVNVVLTNKIVEKDISRVVNSITYNNVIHVTTTVSATAGIIPITGITTDINNYYAPKYGKIEGTNIYGIDFQGIQDSTNTVTKLMSSVFP